MAFPKLPPLDGKALESALKTSVRKPDGSPYAVFDNVQEWVRGERAVRDASAATNVFAHDLKGDIDQHSARIADLEQRVAAVEARPSAPFPVPSSPGG